MSEISEQLSLVSWLSPTRHPPRSLLRAILVLVDLQDLRLFARETLGTTIMDSTTHDRVPYLFSRTDEQCFFTYAQYVEPMTSIAVMIYDIQNAISTRIHHTWGIRIPTLTLQLWFEDPHGYHHRLDTDQSLHQILSDTILYGTARTFLSALHSLGSHPFARLSSDFHAVQAP